MKWMATGRKDFVAVSLDTRDTTRIHTFRKPFRLKDEETILDARGEYVAYCKTPQTTALLLAALNAYESHTDKIEVP